MVPGSQVCNAALNKPAYQISLGRMSMAGIVLLLPAYLANDGDRTTSIKAGSCVEYAGQENPWWAVDLGVPRTVKFLLLTNHGRRFCKFSTSLPLICSKTPVFSRYSLVPPQL